jgi:hypothetical protein
MVKGTAGLLPSLRCPATKPWRRCYHRGGTLLPRHDGDATVTEVRFYKGAAALLQGHGDAATRARPLCYKGTTALLQGHRGRCNDEGCAATPVAAGAMADDSAAAKGPQRCLLPGYCCETCFHGRRRCYDTGPAVRPARSTVLLVVAHDVTEGRHSIPFLRISFGICLSVDMDERLLIEYIVRLMTRGSEDLIPEGRSTLSIIYIPILTECV